MASDPPSRTPDSRGGGSKPAVRHSRRDWPGYPNRIGRRHPERILPRAALPEIAVSRSRQPAHFPCRHQGIASSSHCPAWTRLHPGLGNWQCDHGIVQWRDRRGKQPGAGFIDPRKSHVAGAIARHPDLDPLVRRQVSPRNQRWRNLWQNFPDPKNLLHSPLDLPPFRRFRICRTAP